MRCIVGCGLHYTLYNVMVLFYQLLLASFRPRKNKDFVNKSQISKRFLFYCVGSSKHFLVLGFGYYF